MPVETRSGGHRPPEPKTYKSTSAAPQQRHFPPRRRQVKTYGKTKARPSMKQETLTQMRFVDPMSNEVIDLVSSGDEEGDDEEEYIETAKKARAAKAKRTNRRRTMGDAEDEIEKPRDKKRRKTMGDTPSGPSSSFHTQTLTQFLSNSGEEEDDWKIDEDDEEEAKKMEEEEEFGLIAETPRRKIKTLSSDVLNSAADAQSGRPPDSRNTATPKNRQTKTEIPSSTQSVATPMLLKYSPAKETSPLKTRSTNVGAPTPILKNAHTTPRQVIADSLSPSNKSPATPTPKPQRPTATVKKIRFELPEDKENITPGRTEPKFKQVTLDKPRRGPLTEVPDSDEDLSDEADVTTEDETQDEEDAAPEQSMLLRHDDVAAPVAPTFMEDEKTDIDYEVGVETQAVLLSSAEPSTPTPLPTVETSGPVAVEEHPKLTRQPEESDAGADEIHRAVEQPEVSDAAGETIPSSPRLPSVDLATTSPTQQATQDADEGFTQGLESQRVPLEAIRATGSITDRSDIVISLYREHMARLIDRSKTHEFRGWLMPDTVHRVWIYITKPESVLKYMCLFGPARTAGQIDDTGLGNADFNQGKSSSMKYAYEVLQIFELNNPIPLDKLRENGWPSAPRRYEYIPPAVVGQLTANLRCALLMEEAQLHQDLVPSSPNVTESQEIERQIRSDISHATQVAISSTQDEIIPSSQTPPPKSTAKTSPSESSQVFARPALPTFQHSKSSPSQQQHPLHLSAAPAATSDQPHKDIGFVRPSQATTISQVSSSSPEKSAQLPTMAPSSQAISIPRSENSSPSSYRHRRQSDRSLLRSSQFPTKSQMLPESLINDEIREPPPIVWDSADEESD